MFGWVLKVKVDCHMVKSTRAPNTDISFTVSLDYQALMDWDPVNVRFQVSHAILGPPRSG